MAKTVVPLRQHKEREYVYPSTKSGLSVEQVLQENLFGVDLRAPTTGATFPNTGVWRLIRDAEDYCEKRFAVRFRPTVIRCEPAVEDDQATYDEIEPAYDYLHDMHDSYRWAYLKLRKAPVTDVTEYAYGYPNRNQELFSVPMSWVRLDAPFGMLRLVPDHGGAMANFSAYMLSLFQTGRGIPQSIYVTYKVGHTPEWWRSNHSDLLRAIAERSAAQVLLRLSGLKAAIEGTSMSISADGLSQSRSGAHDALLKQAQERMKGADDAMDAWDRTVKGVRLGWL